MSTYTTHPQERHHHTTASTLQHPLVGTVLALAGAVLVGVLVGVLFSVLFTRPEPAALHGAGGHALPTVLAAQHAASGTAAAVTGETRTVIGSRTDGVRSPARGGFAAGHRAGAGFIVIHVGDRAPMRGGFPTRSLGAGQASAVSMASSPAID